MRPRIPRDADNNVDSDDDDASRETHRQRVGRPNRPRPRRKSFRGALPRSAAVPRHCLTYGEHTTGLVGASEIPGRKRRPGEEREENGLSVRFAVSATSATERQKVRPLPNDLSVFVSRLIYEWGPRETEPVRRLSRALLSVSLYLPSRPVVHGGIRATLFSQLAAFSLSFGVETPVKNLPSPPPPLPPPIHRSLPFFF